MTTYTVAELARTVSRAINRALPEEIWVQGEIRDLSRPSSGHVYFTLIDPDPESSPPAILPVTLFESDKVSVNRVLQQSGAVRMTDGVAVRIRGLVSHYAARGTVQLRMTWIDTDYTLGKLAAERELLIKSLDKRGLLEKNRAVPLPLVPLHVGLITSAGSAAAADFTDELTRSGYAWQVRQFDARVQGTDAVRDVVAGLDTLARRNVDVIAIVRGGGAKTDLAAFDSEEIAIAIATCPIPVLTGIGHEIDVSVADLVARSVKTPTACAAGLVARVTEFAGQLDRVATAVGRATGTRLVAARRDIDHSATRLMRSAKTAGDRANQGLSAIERLTARAGRELLRRDLEKVKGIAGRTARAGLFHLDAAKVTVDRMARMVGATATRRIEGSGDRLAELEHRLGLLDPERLLARGWSITRSGSGDLVLDPADVEPGATLQTTVAGGHIKSVVTEETNDG
jgi:exodeoxyribonuclease VII large subunit